MTNSTITTKISAGFLATVLVAGIIALSSPSFMVGTAQAQPYYGMDSRYNSYEPTEYPDKKYNSYEPEYVMDDPKKLYGNNKL